MASSKAGAAAAADRQLPSKEAALFRQLAKQYEVRRVACERRPMALGRRLAELWLPQACNAMHDDATSPAPVRVALQGPR